MASPQDLKNFTTMKIGGSPERLVKLRDFSESQFLEFLKTEKLPHPLRILGNGSNILIDDRGLKGSVLVVRDLGADREPQILSNSSDETVEVEVPAGFFLPSLCRWAQRQGLSGCEYMIGVPGTVGGAVVQNAGANAQELSHILISARIVNLKYNDVVEKSASELGLSYRHSALMKDSNQLVLSARLRLKRSDANEIQKRIEANQSYRKSKTPSTKPSLGSVFTRIRKDPRKPESDPEAWYYPGKLIEEAGLKGHQIGGAQISPIHANYITNEGNACFDDVMALIKLCEAKVLETSGQNLTREILIWSDR